MWCKHWNILKPTSATDWIMLALIGWSIFNLLTSLVN